MMDVFVVLAISFFLLLFLETESPEDVTKLNNILILDITIEKKNYYSASGIHSIPLERLIGLGGIISVGAEKQRLSNSSEVSVVYGYDEVKVIYKGVLEGNVGLTIFVEKYHSALFATLTSNVSVKAFMPDGSVSEQNVKFGPNENIIHNIDFS